MPAEARDTQAREDRADRRLRHRGVLGGTHRLAPRRPASPDRIRGLLPRRLYRDGTARERSDPEEMRVPPHRVRLAARPWRGLGPPVHRLRAADRPSRDPWGSCQTRRCRTGAGATFPASTGAAGTTTATASHLRPGTRGSLIFHRPGLTGGPTAAGRAEGSRRCSQAPAGQATTHLASPEPAPCCRRRPRRIPGSVPFGGDSVRSKPTSITRRLCARLKDCSALAAARLGRQAARMNMHAWSASVMHVHAA